MVGSSENEKPYEKRWLLYLMHFCFAFVSRMWDMGVVLLVAELTNNSLFYVAVANLFGALAITFLMPTVGHYLDTTDRLRATTQALLLKVTAVSIVYIGCAGATDHHTESVPFFVIYALPIFCGIAALTFKTIVTAVEKDWIVVLSKNDTNWLADTNSIMTQIDLGCSSIAPAATGALFTTCSYEIAALILLGTNALAVVGFYFFLVGLYKTCPSLQSRAFEGMKLGSGKGTGTGTQTNVDEEIQMGEMSKIKGSNNILYGDNFVDADNNSDDDGDILNQSVLSVLSDESTHTRSVGCLEVLFGSNSSIIIFFKSGCASVMLAYSFLYLTVLSFGAIMTVYLRWAGLSDHLIGIFRGINALSGFIGATITPYLKKKFGLRKAGLGAIWYQFVLVSIASASFLFCSREKSSIVVVYTVLLSRAGLWVFDLCSRQIVQETLNEETRGTVNGLWASIVSFFNMTSFIMAMLVSDPRDFFVLTSISATFVGLAAITYSITAVDVSVLSCLQKCTSSRFRNLTRAATWDDGNMGVYKRVVQEA